MHKVFNRQINIFLLILAASLLFYLTGFIERSFPHGDIAAYKCFATSTLHFPLSQSCHQFASSSYDIKNLSGFPQIYPFVADIFFTLPFTLSFFLTYNNAFGLIMTLLVALLFSIIYKQGGLDSLLANIVYFILGSLTLITSRFDVLVVTLILSTIIFAQKKKFIVAYILLTLAFLLKLFPIILFVPLFIYQLRASKPKTFWHKYGGIIVSALITIAFCVFVLILDPGYFIKFLEYFSLREIEVESLPASIIALGFIFHLPLCLSSQTFNLVFGSFNAGQCTLPSPLSNMDIFFAAISSLAVIGYFIGILWTIYLQFKRQLSLTDTFIALILLTLCLSKLFSPQYIIWLSPLIAFRYRLSPIWISLWGSVCVLTTIDYPYLFSNLPVTVSPLMIFFFVIVGLRNFLIAALFFSLLKNLLCIRTVKFI